MLNPHGSPGIGGSLWMMCSTRLSFEPNKAILGAMSSCAFVTYGKVNYSKSMHVHEFSDVILGDPYKKTSLNFLISVVFLNSSAKAALNFFFQLEMSTGILEEHDNL